jgi:DNA-directed RNA polymerase subunit RPC12/RpoP
MNEAQAELDALLKDIEAKSSCKGNHTFRAQNFFNDGGAGYMCVYCGQTFTEETVKLYTADKHTKRGGFFTAQMPYPGVADCLHDFFALEANGIDYGKCKRCGAVKLAREIDSSEWEKEYWDGK